MFKLNCNTGHTYLFDTEEPDEYANLLMRLKNIEFQNSITAVSIVRHCGRGVKCPVCNRKARILCQECGEIEHDTKCQMGVQYSLPRPKKYNKVFFVLESVQPSDVTKGYERIKCFADEVQIVATVHKSQPSVCVTLHKIGNIRYNSFKD